MAGRQNIKRINDMMRTSSICLSSSLLLLTFFLYVSLFVPVEPYEVDSSFDVQVEDSPLPYPIAVSREDIYNNLRGVLGSIYSQYSRGLIGSNCVMIEGGTRTPYSYCTGCRIEEAVNCVEDMRYNRTGSVPLGCHLRGLLQTYEPQCCPTLDSKTRRIDRRTSAYPFAFSCLASVGCMTSEVARSLKEECEAQCSSNKVQACNPYPDYSVAEEVICFPSSERVIHETQGEIPISHVKIGDSILSANRKGETKFSQVIAFPHDVNNGKLAIFHELTLSDGSQVRMSPEHVLPVGQCHDNNNCNYSNNYSNNNKEVFPFVQAVDAKIGSCVYTHKRGSLPIISNERVQGEGVYSFVTNEELIVVGGVVTSPYAVSHNVANTYYKVFRWCFHHLGEDLFTSINAIVSGGLALLYPMLSQLVAFHKI